MIDAFNFILVAFVSYFIGTINFSKIIAWYFRHKDITKVGSGNPGTMNMLRTFGFGLALTTFVAEVIKSGLTCLACKLIFPDYGQVIYFFAGFFILMGYMFPVWTKFKGGKGVACFAGIFLFSNLWYVALAWFVVCFILLIFIDYGCIISFTYIGGLVIAYTIYVWIAPVADAWIITAIIWFLFALMIFMHRGNIKRLINHTENKIDFKGKLRKVFCHKKGEQIIEEENVEQKPEQEIIIEPGKEQTAEEEIIVTEENAADDNKNTEGSDENNDNNDENK